MKDRNQSLQKNCPLDVPILCVIAANASQSTMEQR